MSTYRIERAEAAYARGSGDIPGPIGIAEERDRARDALSGAREAWDAWQEAWRDLVGAMENAGISTVRIDAYRVGSGHDEGGGQSLEGWLDEIEQQIDSKQEGDPNDDHHHRAPLQRVRPLRHRATRGTDC